MRLKCLLERKLLNRYADGEISEKKLSCLKLHLEECAYCKAQLDDLLQAKKIILEKEKVQASSDFLTRLKERLRPEPQIVRLRWVQDMGNWSRRLIPVPIALGLIVFGLLFSEIENTKADSGDLLEGLTNGSEASLDSSLSVDAVIFNE